MWHHIPEDSIIHFVTVRTSAISTTIVIFTLAKEILSSTFIPSVEKAIKQFHTSCAEL
jgi:hypothetical protein